MKKIKFNYWSSLLILLFVLFKLDLLAQPTIQWQKSLGGSGDDKAYSIDLTRDGGYIVAGYTDSNDGDISCNNVIQDVLILKLDSNGSIQWQKCIGGSEYNIAYSVEQTRDGGYIIAGSTLSNNGDVSCNHGLRDFLVIKLDSSGIIQWHKCFGGSDYDEATSIQQTNDDGFIVTGYTKSYDGDVSDSHGSYDFWVVKLNSFGQILWQKCFGGTGWEVALSVRLTSDGGYIVAGYSTSSNGDIKGKIGDNNDVWIVKLDSIGKMQWNKFFDGPTLSGASSIEETIDRGYIIAGSTSSLGNSSCNHGDSDALLLKIDSLGNVQWQKCLGGKRDDDALSVKQTSDSGFIFVGQTQSNDGDVSGNHGGWFDVWVVKLDVNGNIKWQKSLGGSNEDVGYSVQQTNTGAYIVAGYTNSINGDVIGNHGGYDVWVVKLNPEITGIEEKSPEIGSNTLNLTPNPASEFIEISFNSVEPFQLKISDLLGENVMSLNGSDTMNKSVDVSNLPNGTYYVQLISTSKLLTQKIVIIH